MFDKEDEILAVQDKLTAEKEVGAEMVEEIKKLNERVKELEDDLANRPEPKDDSSDSYSDKDEKEDNSAEIEEWKSKYEKIS